MQFFYKCHSSLAFLQWLTLRSENQRQVTNVSRNIILLPTATKLVSQISQSTTGQSGGWRWAIFTLLSSNVEEKEANFWRQRRGSSWLLTTIRHEFFFILVYDKFRHQSNRLSPNGWMTDCDRKERVGISQAVSPESITNVCLSRRCK